MPPVSLTPRMQDLARQFASGLSGKLNFLATAAQQWKAAFWFKHGHLVNITYCQQWADGALFNFCYDFGPALMEQDHLAHPLAPLTWVAEPEVFKENCAWSWPWPSFWSAWQENLYQVGQYQQKAPLPSYYLHLAGTKEVAFFADRSWLLAHLSCLERKVLKSIEEFPLVEDLYSHTPWPKGDLTRCLVRLKQQGLIRATR